MDMPKPLDEHRRLKSLAGNWVGEEKIHPSPWDPNGGGATSRIQSRLDMDGFFLVSDYVEERNGQVAYRGHGVYGYDPQQKSYTMHWFDSMGAGTPEPARGRWEGNRLVFENKNPMGHNRFTYALDGENRYTFTLENSQDGTTWVPFMEGKFTRA